MLDWADSPSQTRNAHLSEEDLDEDGDVGGDDSQSGDYDHDGVRGGAHYS